MTPIDHTDPTPLYAQLAGILRTRIDAGEITGRLPSIRTLTQEYDVSHVTAEKAIGILRQEGLIVTTVGRGSFVRKNESPG